jgi:hypothetical protein
MRSVYGYNILLMLLLNFFSMKPNVIKRKEGRDSIEKIRRVIVFIKFVPWVFDSSPHIYIACHTKRLRGHQNIIRLNLIFFLKLIFYYFKILILKINFKK